MVTFNPTFKVNIDAACFWRNTRMAPSSPDRLVARSTRAVANRLGEFVHVCAIYLGIAALVTIVLGAVVPSLREQSRQMHSALVSALRPPGLGQDIAIGLDGADGSLSTGSRDINFNRVLSASIAGHSISGISEAQGQALRSYVARKYKIAHSVAGALIETVFMVGREKKLDPQLLLAVIAIESRYNPYAESHVGAQGLMQVMTKVHKEKFEPYGDGRVAALNPIANIHVGAQILQDCIKRRGSLEGGLACYVGATGPGDGGYGAKVLAERRRIALASGIPIGRN